MPWWPFIPWYDWVHSDCKWNTETLTAPQPKEIFQTIFQTCFKECAIELAPILAVIFNKSPSQGIVSEELVY